jgi:hypothetical protein
VVLVGFCALEATLAWRGPLRQESVGLDWDLIAYAGVVAFLLQVFAKFSLVRERLVLGLMILRLGAGLIARFIPTLSFQAGSGPLIVWVLALGLSLSMLYSSVRFRNPVVS